MCIMVISGPNFRPFLELQRGLGVPWRCSKNNICYCCLVWKHSLSIWCLTYLCLHCLGTGQVSSWFVSNPLTFSNAVGVHVCVSSLLTWNLWGALNNSLLYPYFSQMLLWTDFRCTKTFRRFCLSKLRIGEGCEAEKWLTSPVLQAGGHRSNGLQHSPGRLKAQGPDPLHSLVLDFIICIATAFLFSSSPFQSKLSAGAGCSSLIVEGNVGSRVPKLLGWYCKVLFVLFHKICLYLLWLQCKALQRPMRVSCALLWAVISSWVIWHFMIFVCLSYAVVG